MGFKADGYDRKKKTPKQPKKNKTHAAPSKVVLCEGELARVKSTPQSHDSKLKVVRYDLEMFFTNSRSVHISNLTNKATNTEVLAAIAACQSRVIDARYRLVLERVE